MARRRTPKRYADLYHDPASMFPGISVTLFPNGAPEIWLKAGPHSVRLTASAGPHGLSIHISPHVGAALLAVRTDDQRTGTLATRDVSIVQYNDTPEARAFARWYDHQETAEDVALLGPKYRRMGSPA